MQSGFDYFLSLEQDIIPPPNIIERLLIHNKAVISGLYYKHSSRRRAALPMVIIGDKNMCKEKPTCGRRAQISEIQEPKLMETLCPGVGCMLIKREVLEKVCFRYERNHRAFDDVYFCEDARAAGYKIFCDTSVVCDHWDLGTDWTMIRK